MEITWSNPDKFGWQFATINGINMFLYEQDRESERWKWGEDCGCESYITIGCESTEDEAKLQVYNYVSCEGKENLELG